MDKLNGAPMAWQYSKRPLLGTALLAIVAAACAAEVVDPGSTPAESSQADVAVETLPSEAEMAPETVIAALDLSATHRIEFVQLAGANIVGVRETFHVDRDDLDATAMALLPEGAELPEIYEVMAADRLDTEVLERLIDAQLGKAVPALAHEPAASEEDVANLGMTRQALCTEPAWDWTADDAWFRQHFCGFNFQYCSTLLGKHASSLRGKFSDAFHFNQSHCSSAKFSLSVGYNTACTWWGRCTYRRFSQESGTLAPRLGQWTHWYFTGKDAWDLWPTWSAGVTSDTGNFTALSHHVYTQ